MARETMRSHNFGAMPGWKDRLRKKSGKKSPNSGCHMTDLYRFIRSAERPSHYFYCSENKIENMKYMHRRKELCVLNCNLLGAKRFVKIISMEKSDKLFVIMEKNIF